VTATFDAEFIRDKGRALPIEQLPARVRSLRVWHCAYETLQPLELLRDLEVLVIANFPDHDLEVLSSLRTLRYLSIIHLPKVTDLQPLLPLSRLECLSLATLPSWDSSGRVTEVASLEPLAALPSLRNLELFGVRPPDCSLALLQLSPSLRSARFSRYPATEMRRFYAATGLANSFNPEPPLGSA
jgi:hypothetical protein